jgi:hypothetical protein
MYKRNIEEELLPEYRVIVNSETNVKINIDELTDKVRQDKCIKTIKNKANDTTNTIQLLDDIDDAFINYVSVEDYVDCIFEKDITTRYKKKTVGVRNKSTKLIVTGEEPDVKVSPKCKRIKQKVKLVFEDDPVVEEVDKQEYIIQPKPKTKTKKEKQEIIIFPKKKTLKASPHGKKKPN